MFSKIKNFIPTRVKTAIKALLYPKPEGADDFNSKYLYPRVWLSAQEPFFGQYGEDLKILSLFAGKSDGYFI